MKSIIQTIFSSRKLFWVYFSVIILLITIPLNSSEKLNNISIVSFRGDYFFHSLMFIPWAFFLPAFRSRILIWLLLGLTFAGLSEGLQYFLTYRAYNINDLVANMLGVLIGMFLFIPVKKMTGIK
jgi:glycopeptide antibiotics resistance protein